MSFSYAHAKDAFSCMTKKSESHAFNTLPSTPRLSKSPADVRPKMKLRFSIFPKRKTYTRSGTGSQTTATSIPLSPRSRRAAKAAVALQTLLLHHPSSLSAIQSQDTTTTHPEVGEKEESGEKTEGRLRSIENKTRVLPRLREKDVTRLQGHLLHPDSAQRLMKAVKNLPLNGGGIADLKEPQPPKLPLSGPSAFLLGSVAMRTGNSRAKHNGSSTLSIAVCLDCIEQEADHENERLSKPTLISLLKAESLHIGPSTMTATTSILRASLSLRSSTSQEVSKHFDEVLAAETKVYGIAGPSHMGLKVPIDRMSVMTYWWGFEVALPPPTLIYLAHVKDVTQAVLDLLSVLVFAVPGGARELSPFIGLLSRFVDAELRTIIAQDRGQGVVCGATWFIPAAIVARPWDFESRIETEFQVSPISESEIHVPIPAVVEQTKFPKRSFVVKRPATREPIMSLG